jgi:hypothetical protein
MLMLRSVLTGHGRPLLCGGVEHDTTEMAKRVVVVKKEEPIADPLRKIF